jgi:hypothetical protein
MNIILYWCEIREDSCCRTFYLKKLRTFFVGNNRAMEDFDQNKTSITQHLEILWTWKTEIE